MPAREETHDFIVVGAGPAGSILALRLAATASAPSVLLLEAGGSNSDLKDLSGADRFATAFKPDSPLNWGYKISQHGREIDYSRGRGLGGSTAINFCGWTTGPKDDFDEWARLVGDEAFGWESVRAMFKGMVKLHKKVPEGFREVVRPADGHGTDGEIDLTYGTQWQDSVNDVFHAARETGLPLNPDVNDGDPIGMGIGTVCIHEGVRITAANAFLSNPPPNLTIRSNSHVANVFFEGECATGVQLVDGTSITARKEVILSAGALNTPQLLQLSGIGPAEFLQPYGITPIHELQNVGRNLQDHCFSTFGITIPVNQTADQDIDQSPTPMGWSQSSALLASSEFAALPAETQDHLRKSTVPHWELCTHTPLLAPHTPHPNERPFAAMALLMNPQSRGTVRLASASPEAAPAIDPQFLKHPFDRRSMIEAVRALIGWFETPVWTGKTARKIGWPEGRDEEAVLKQVHNNLGSSWHMSGTVRMGKSASDACVDSNFRVFGLRGLRVVDMSVVPFLPSAHTQSTAYLIGAIAAEKIAAEFGLKELAGNSRASL